MELNEEQKTFYADFEMSGRCRSYLSDYESAQNSPYNSEHVSEKTVMNSIKNLEEKLKNFEKNEPIFF